MQIFLTNDSTTFKFNGLKYVKNFMIIKQGETNIAVHNVYDTKYQLMGSTPFSQISVNGTVYGSLSALMNVLSPLLFSKTSSVNEIVDFEAQATELIENLVAVAQDNKRISVQVNTNVTPSPTAARIGIWEKVNLLPTFQVGEKELLSVKNKLVTQSDGMYYISGLEIWDVFEVGKGTYGIGGTQLTSNNFRLPITTTPTPTDYIDDPSSQVIPIASLSGQTIAQYVNTKNPPYTIQLLVSGRTLFITPNGSYLFEREGGYYGIGGITNTTLTDYTLISDIPVPIVIENTIISGSTSAVSGGAVYDELALQQAQINSLNDNNTYITGGTFSNGTAVLSNNSGGTVSVTGITSNVWKAADLTTNVNNATDVIYRNGTTNLIGTEVFYSTTPTVDSDTLGSSFGHIAGGGGTTAFIQLFGQGANSGLPNVMIGSTAGADVSTPHITFTAVKSTAYDKFTDGGRKLFTFKNGYGDAESLFDVGTDYLQLWKYPTSRNQTTATTINYLSTDSNGILVSKSISGITADLSNQINTLSATKADLVNGKIPNNQLPALAITDTFPVNSQSAMLALSTAEQGDVAVRTDINKTFILTQSPYSTLGNWQELLSPTDSVTSVNGQVGVVNLTKSNVGLSNVDNTSDANKPISTATQTALDLKANDSTVLHNNATEEFKSGRLNVSGFTFGKSIGLIDNTDLDGLDTGGFYYGGVLLNSPTSGYYYVLVESLEGASWIKQTVTSLGSGNVPNNTYIRVRVLGVWTSWKLSANDADVDNKYLSKIYLSSKYTADANNISEGTQTQYLSGANQPDGTTDGSLLSLSYSTDYSTQMFADWRTNKFFTRTRSSADGWLAWKQLAFDADKANLVGGNTFNGNQTINGFLKINKDSTTSSITLENNSYGTDTPSSQISYIDGLQGKVAEIYTEFDGTNMSLNFGSLYNGGYNSDRKFKFSGNGNIELGNEGKLINVYSNINRSIGFNDESGIALKTDDGDKLSSYLTTNNSSIESGLNDLGSSINTSTSYNLDGNFYFNSNNASAKGLLSQYDYSLNNDGTDRNIYPQTGWVQDYVGQATINFIPLSGTTNLNGTIGTSDSYFQIGRNSDYKSFLSLTDLNNSSYPNQSFSMAANIYDGLYASSFSDSFDGLKNGILQVNKNGFEASYDNATGGKKLEIGSTNIGIVLKDSIDNLGLVGFADYSANNNGTDRKIYPQTGWVTDRLNERVPANTSWINITTNSLPAAFSNIVLRYKIKNGNYILDFSADCAGSGSTTATNYTFATMAGIDSEKLKFINIDSYSLTNLNALRKITLRSSGDEASAVEMVLDYSDVTSESVAIRVSLPIASI